MPFDVREIEALREDRRSGASELLARAVTAARQAAAEGPAALEACARALVATQPSMAPFWTLALAALAERRRPGTIERFDARRLRGLAAIERHVVSTLCAEGDTGADLHVTTWSSSRTVLACLIALHRTRRVRVACAEGRPALEGRGMAGQVAAAGMLVDFHTDSAVADVLLRPSSRTDVVLVGADAVAPDWFVNKAGTSMLAALAERVGVPVYVAATSDKFLDARVAAALPIESREPGEVWEAVPAGVAVENRYFEKTPLGWVSGVFSDAGLLAGGMIDEACRASAVGTCDDDIARLTQP
jgi:translation initiation factor 2B subunit (eIF-2B alpha/beta/delta family)